MQTKIFLSHETLRDFIDRLLGPSAPAPPTRTDARQRLSWCLPTTLS